MSEANGAALAERNLKKHVAAIHIENRLSLLERKMANVLLLNAYSDLLSQDIHRIRIRDLAAVLGFDSNDHDCLKRALINLMSTVLTWNILDSHSNEKTWKARPMLVSADIDRTWCWYAYHEDLRRKLFNPEIYSRINLGIQRKFTSGHALALYENCLRYRKTGSTGWWDLDTLRKLLGVGSNSYYADFRRLNSKVIKPAINQINSTSDILLTTESKREKRRVVAIRFTISDNPQMSLFGSAGVDRLDPVQCLEVPAVDGEDMLARLIDFGLRKEEAESSLQDHDPRYIDDNLEIVADMYARGAIRKTLRAATLDALKRDYRPQRAPYEQRYDTRQTKAEIQKNEPNRTAQATEERERLRREFDKLRLQQALELLPQEQRNELQSRFERLYRRDSVFRRCFKGGYGHPIVQSLFQEFASRELLDDCPETELEEFIALRQA